MNEQDIQALANTLGQLMIPATFDNVNRVLGMYMKLEEMRKSDQQEEAVKEDGV